MTIFYDDYHDNPPLGGYSKTDYKKLYSDCDAVTNKITHIPTRFVVSNLIANITSEIDRLNRHLEALLTNQKEIE